MLIFESWLGTFFEFCVIYIIYKITDRIIRIPYVDCLESRYILITGCDTGFGNLLAKRLDILGCHVFAGCLTESGETELRKSCSCRLTTVNLDVTKTESIQKAFQLVNNKLPPGKGLWGLISLSHLAKEAEIKDRMTVEEYTSLSRINGIGMVDVITAFISLIRHEKGRLIGTSRILTEKLTVSAELSNCYLIDYIVKEVVQIISRAAHLFGIKVCLVELNNRIRYMNEETRNSSETIFQPTIKDIARDKGRMLDLKQESVPLQEISSTELNEVVDAHEHALLAQYPRAHYVVGKNVRLNWLNLISLPEWLNNALPKF